MNGNPTLDGYGGQSTPESLPFTGADLTLLLVVGLVILLAGLAISLWARRAAGGDGEG